MPFRLVVISGQEYLFPNDSEQPGVYQLRDNQTITIGRGGSADIRFAGHDAQHDMAVARRQADLEVDDGGVRILDYGSSRGASFRRTVALNRQPIEGDGKRWISLTPGDEIRIGASSFRLEKCDEQE